MSVWYKAMSKGGEEGEWMVVGHGQRRQGNEQRLLMFGD